MNTSGTAVMNNEVILLGKQRSVITQVCCGSSNVYLLNDVIASVMIFKHFFQTTCRQIFNIMAFSRIDDLYPMYSYTSCIKLTRCRGYLMYFVTLYEILVWSATVQCWLCLYKILVEKY